ncbi:MAG: methyltransferase domain-containing protein [Gemmatimonadales bacterium]|nr:methyltransferase domain-containing protein [Gemmatimonadales bacterium]
MSPSRRADALARYDRAYFDKFYRHPRHRVHTAASIARKVRLAVALAEFVLERPVRRVLDIGAGEGAWQPHLTRLRPGVRYLGIEPSEWAVRRWGARRNLVRGTIEELDTLGLDGPYDLIIAADVLYYLPTPVLRRGLAAIAGLLGGVAWLEGYTTGDDVEGDLEGWHPRSPAAWRRLFRTAGLEAFGPQAWLRADRACGLAELERPAPR